MSSSDLKSVVYCPDCGGVVGATAPSEAGQPCRCFQDFPPRRAQEEVGANGESVEEPSGVEAPGPTTEKKPKICIICGKDVSGHRRLKDSRGYRCLSCAKQEELKNKVQGVKCPRCARTVKEESIGELNGERMCQRCLREQRELTRPGSKRYRKIDDQHFEKSKKTQIIVLSAIAFVLFVFIVIGLLK